MRITLTGFAALALLHTGPALAEEAATLHRVDDKTAELEWKAETPVGIWLSDDTLIDRGDRLVASGSKARRLKLDMPVDRRSYVILQERDGSSIVVAERELPLAQGSNFRDVGGYETKDGRTVRWGKVYRSGAMPMLSEGDYALLSQLDLDSIVDLRSLEEREIAPDLLDDRTGALFLANDYSFQALWKNLQAGNGENMYKGTEKFLAPQYRMIFNRILAEDGAVVYHCSAGQDRTGVATALLYDVLGVDRETILKDYHLSTELRRPQWEMPELDPAKYPGNPMVKFYAEMQAKGVTKAQPLYTASGASHLAQFFTYLDQEYGSTEAYLKQELGFTDADISKLREIMLK
jgi:protein-tyrosine phosphatase